MKRRTILVFLMVVLTSTGYSWADLSSGLIAYYPFSGNANHITSNGHDGTVYGATLTTDRFGNPNSAYSFDGVDDYIRISNSSHLDGMDSLTLSVWVKLNGNNNQEMEVLNKYNHYSGNLFDDSYNIGIDGWGPLAVFQYATNDNYVIKISNDPLSIDAWYHIVGVYTGTEGTLYINGNKVSLSRNDPDFGGPLNSITSDLLIGCGEASGSLIKYFSGEIDDVRIYDRALNGSEVFDLSIVPVPGAVILGCLGLTFSGWFLKRKRMV